MSVSVPWKYEVVVILTLDLPEADVQILSQLSD
jgi:hypothetical protein